MTVKELKEKLSTCSDEAKVIIFDLDDNDYDMVAVLNYKTQVHIVYDGEPKDNSES